LFFGFVTAAAWIALAYGIYVSLGLDRGKWPLPETLIFLLAIPALPWWIVGFWNSIIGLWLLQTRRDGLHEAAPFWRIASIPLPLELRVAVIMTLRNEDPARAMTRLRAVRDSLDATGEGAQFDYFILSDTSLPNIAEKEEALCAAWDARYGGDSRLTYRRRERNEGFKAGNVRDFLDRWGDHYNVMLPLDADSVMSGDMIVRLARVMQAFPKLGILQSLVAGAPSTSAFARMFQFGMRHSMRSYTTGSAWWTGDCGPYWGHNALIRVQPFKEACDLPVLPGKPPLGGHILSHDQIEAALMRRAGYEVRVLPVEGGSYEDNPPTLLDFLKRDIRWCLGNMQYVRLLGLPGLRLVSQVQIILAIFMYLGSFGLAAIAAVAAIAAALGGLQNVNGSIASTVAALLLLMSLTPKLAGLANVLLTEGEPARYGGVKRVVAGALVEIVFSLLLSVIVTFGSAVFMVGLIFGRSVSWGGQARDTYGLSLANASRALWPQTLAGFAPLALLAPAAGLSWALPIIAALGLSIPLAIVSSSPRLGAAMVRAGLCAIPEEFTPVEILQRAGGVEPEGEALAREPVPSEAMPG
jgi:membrane glycosyltransferase